MHDDSIFKINVACECQLTGKSIFDTCKGNICRSYKNYRPKTSPAHVNSAITSQSKTHMEQNTYGAKHIWSKTHMAQNTDGASDALGQHGAYVHWMTCLFHVP